MPVILWPNVLERAPILSSLLLKAIRNQNVILPRANTEIEGEFNGKGNIVSVPVFPTLDLDLVSAWSTGNSTWTGNRAGEDITETTFAITYESLTLDTLYQKNIRVGDFEQFSSDIAYVSNVMSEYIKSVSQILDTAVAAIAIAGVNNSHKLGSWSATVNSTNIYTALESMVVLLDWANAPEDRAVFMLPEMISELRQSTVYQNTERGLDHREKGLVVNMVGMNIYSSNNVPSNFFFAMSRGAVHFVAAFIGLKTTEAENAFATKVLAELVYGGEVFGIDDKKIVTYEYDDL